MEIDLYIHVDTWLYRHSFSDNNAEYNFIEQQIAWKVQK